MADYGISTLGIQLWAAESPESLKITDVTKYKRLHRINSIGELSLEPSNIDASALEDYVTRYVAGRSDVSDTYTITINVTDDTVEEWTELLGKKICFLTYIPGLTKQIFVIATVPAKLPVSGLDQNSLYTAAFNCTTNDFIGLDTPIDGLDTSATDSISLNRTTATIDVGDTVTLTATTIPAGQTVTWTTSDDTVATVTNGTVTGVAAGNAVIRASSGGISAACVVTVQSI